MKEIATKRKAIDEEKITQLKGIAELRDSGAFTEKEFLEHKSRILNEIDPQTVENYKGDIISEGFVSRFSISPVRSLAIICAILLAGAIFNDLFLDDYETPETVYLDMEVCYDIVYEQTNYNYSYMYNYKDKNGSTVYTNITYVTNQTEPLCFLFKELVYLNASMAFDTGFCDYECYGRVQIFVYGENSGLIAVKGERKVCEMQSSNGGWGSVSCRSSYAGTLEW
jgi:hypothetical protein|tara:strand:+ start:51 stop:725 length:675 start_codon:yes stop_codon:yes gene_type:complete